ncbi:MAG: zinc-dependent peptidase [Kofleriaceae bacterium]
MAAEVVETTRDVAAPNHEPVASPVVDANVRAMINATHGDPDQIAAQLLFTGKSNDPHVFAELQQALGNGTTLKVREAITRTRQDAIDRATGTTSTNLAGPQEQPTDLLPAQVERQILGVTITAPAGVRASALQEVQAIVQTEIGKNEYAQKHFQKCKVAIIIIPAHVAMTDLPELKHLKGQKTFDGRDWSTVRGMGGTPTPNGRFSIAVAEETTTRVADIKTNYPATYSVTMHELAHVLESKGMTPAEQARVKELYAAHAKKDPGDKADTFTDSYGAENEREYFAQCTNAFFDRNVMGKNHSGKQWLYKTDPDMYAFLVQLYSKHHDQDGKVDP